MLCGWETDAVNENGVAAGLSNEREEVAGGDGGGEVAWVVCVVGALLAKSVDGKLGSHLEIQVRSAASELVALVMAAGGTSVGDGSLKMSVLFPEVSTLALFVGFEVAWEVFEEHGDDGKVVLLLFSWDLQTEE